MYSQAFLYKAPRATYKYFNTAQWLAERKKGKDLAELLVQAEQVEIVRYS